MPSFDIYQLIIIAGAINALVLFFSLASLPFRFRRPAVFLGLFIVGYIIYLINWIILPDLGNHLDSPVLWIPTLFYLPALALFFGKSISTKENQNIDWRFLIPGILDSIYQVSRWVYDLSEGTSYYFPLNNSGLEYYLYEGLGIIFSIFCAYKIYNIVLEKTATYQFYKYVYFLFVFILLRWTVLFSLDIFNPQLLSVPLQFTFWTIELTLFLFIGYKNLLAPNKSQRKLVNKPTDVETAESNALLSYLNHEKLYLNQNLSRRDLAEKLNISEVKVSSILNDQLNTTFYGLINDMRVEEAKNLLDSGMIESLSLEGIAKQSGFRSRATFYKFFKINTGTTPTEYLTN